MVSSHNAHRAVAVLLVVAAGTARARDNGSIQGRVEDAQGAPVSNVVVSVFGKGLTSGGIVGFTDNTGAVTLPALPAGNYTLRAVGVGQQRAMAQKITVRAEERTFFSVSLTPPERPVATAAGDEA